MDLLGHNRLRLKLTLVLVGNALNRVQNVKFMMILARIL